MAMYEMMVSYFHDGQRKKLLQDRLQAGLSEEQRRFLEAAEIGNLDVVKDLLETEKVKIDCADQQGRTALELAVSGNDVDVVCYLLERSPPRMIHKALLCAADNDVERISELILDHPFYRDCLRRQMGMHKAAMEGAELPAMGEQETDLSEDEKLFSQANVNKLLREVLLRAAKRNNFQIVKKIMMHGVFLDVPHDYFCACGECTMWRREDFKVFTTSRLDTFRALASPAYIALTEEDPFISAFQLSQKFRSLSEIEGEFKQVYNELDQQVQNFTIDLLDQCQSSDEVKTVLSGKPKVRDKNGQDVTQDNGSDILPMVHTALRMGQKRFVAHPQCQAQIGELWYSGVPFLRYLNRFLYLMLALPLGLVACPVLSMLYLVAPWSKVGKIVNTPLMKFLSYTCSYLTFLVVIIVSKLHLRFAFNSFVCDHPPNYAYAIVIVILMWIVGLIWEEVKQIWEAGATDYFNSLWNVIDSIMLGLLLASFVLELVTPIRINRAIRVTAHSGNDTAGYLSHESTVDAMCRRVAFVSSRTEFCETKARTSYVSWNPSWVPDPELLSDVLFTLGTILSISRFSFIMPVNEALGTMLVSFRRTIADLLKITGMFLLVLMSFACGIAALYAPNKCDTESFNSFSTTLSTLTWSVFGMGNVDAPDLTTRGPVTSLTNNPIRSAGVAAVGQYLYGIYVFASMIVLLNLLIAVMSNTFNEVQDERDIEWKFARTELWLTFIEPGTPVPPPFNVVPSPRNIWNGLLWLCRRSELKFFLPHEGKQVRYAAVQTGSMDFSETGSVHSVSIVGKRTRQDVMCILVRRYVREVERKKIEGEDGDKTSSEEQMRRLIERIGAKLEKRVEEVYINTGRVQRDVIAVRDDSTRIAGHQQEQIDLLKAFSENRLREMDRYIRMLDETKLDVLSRMDAERLQMERVLQQRMSDFHQQLLNDMQQHLRQLQQQQREAKYPPPKSPTS